jgi:hypothetical protein
MVGALELRWVGDPYGQVGVTPVMWDFSHGFAVHDALWWGLDWTAGGREMGSKFLGPEARSHGTGRIVAVSTEYDFSVARILKHPATFDGNGPDLRVAVSFIPFWTLRSDDPTYDSADGYFIGADLQYVLRSWISTAFRLFGESRDSATTDILGQPVKGRWTTYNGTIGLVFHSDWQSRDRIELAYSAYFYSDFADNNPQRPLDRQVITLGGSLAF